MQLELCTHMYTTGLRELRTSLAEAVRRANSGERTIITAHGTPIAQLAPLDEAVPGIALLVSSGALIEPRRRGVWIPPTAAAMLHGVRIDKALREVR